MFTIENTQVIMEKLDALLQHAVWSLLADVDGLVEKFLNEAAVAKTERQIRSILYKIFLEKNLENYLAVRKTSRFSLELLFSFQGSCFEKNLEKVETSSFWFV